MASAVRRITVSFQGATPGVEDLTWGQREIWTAMVAQRSWLPIFSHQRLPPGTTIDDVVRALRHRLHRYDSLRTRLEFGPDGEPRQVVAGAGEVLLEVFEASGTDPWQLAVEVREQYREGAYDFVRDWPVRTAVILHDGRPWQWVSVYCHLVTDAFGLAILAEDPDGAVPTSADPTGAERTGADPHGAGPGDTDPGGAMRPVRLARWERSEPARALSTMAMRRWERHLREIPAHRFPVPTGSPGPSGSRDLSGSGGPRYWEAVFRSRAMYLALRVLSPRATEATAPLLALFAMAVTRVGGSDPVVAQVVVSNRFHTHLAGVFAPVNQTGLWVVEVGDATYEEVARRSRRKAMSAYKYAYYDPRDRAALIDRVSRERGVPLDVACYVNDRRMGAGADPDGARPGEGDILDAVVRSTFAWRTRTDKPSDRFVLNVEDAADEVHLTAWTDTAHLAPQRLEAILREMETIAVRAATRQVAPHDSEGSAPGRGDPVSGGVTADA